MDQKLYDAYFAFEALSEHNWDSGVCGICGMQKTVRKGEVSTKNFRLQQ